MFEPVRFSSSRLWVLAAVVLLAHGVSARQSAPPSSPAKVSGPAIEKYGATFEVPGAVLVPSPEVEYKVKFDVASAAGDASAVNPALDTVARFVNMHVRAGVPHDRVKAAVILHGGAARDALGDAGYRARHGAANPNLPLLEALDRAGVRVYVCGQSVASQGFTWDELAPVAKLALSAMTAHAVLEREGYTTNPF